MSSLNAHFGIGTATQISQIVIKWPSGVIDIIDNPSINQTLNVVEGSFALHTPGFNTKSITIYPNPTTDVLFIENQENIEISSLKIYAVNGTLVKTVAANATEINVKELSDGIYMLSIETKEGAKITERFIKKN